MVNKTGLLLAAVIGGVAVWYLSKRKQQSEVAVQPPAETQRPIPVPENKSTQPVRPEPLPGLFPYNPLAQPHADPFTGAQVPVDDPYPRQQPDIVAESLLNKIVAELAANDHLEEVEREALYEEIQAEYYNELLEIARLNDYRLGPLRGPAQAKYSSLMLILAHLNDYYLTPSSRALHRAQLFAYPIHHFAYVPGEQLTTSDRGMP